MKITLQMLEDAKEGWVQDSNLKVKWSPSSLLSEQKSYEYMLIDRRLKKELLAQIEVLWKEFEEHIPAIFTDYAEEMTTLRCALGIKIDLATSEYHKHCASAFFHLLAARDN